MFPAPPPSSRQSAPRLYVPQALVPGQPLQLPPAAARHVQVLRLQPGMAVTLFNGEGGEYRATVRSMGRSEVEVDVGAFDARDAEMAFAVTIALGVPANDRMDALVEKATELGVAAIQPLLCERSVLRLSGERADKRREHWQATAVAACEQSGRTRVPEVRPIEDLRAWLARPAPAGAVRWVLSLSDGAKPMAALARGSMIETLSGPEGGLSAGEEQAAMAAGFLPLSLGPRVLRADTAPLAVLAGLGALG